MMDAEHRGEDGTYLVFNSNNPGAPDICTDSGGSFDLDTYTWTITPYQQSPTILFNIYDYNITNTTALKIVNNSSSTVEKIGVYN